MTDFQAWFVLIPIVVFVWPVASIILFDDSCQRGFWSAYKAHLIGWLAIFFAVGAIFFVVFGFFASLDVLLK